MDNILLLTDSYKVTHWKQYPPETQKIYSYFESRGGQFEKTVFFGLQYLLKKYLEGKVITKEKIEQAKMYFGKHFGKNLFNEEGWQYIIDKYDGALPVSIKAVPEGCLVDTHNILMSIENTDDKCFWLTNYLETLLVQVWYPTTVATLSYYMRRMIEKYLEETGDISGLDFKLHDFGFRGVSSVESAAIGGAAHLLNFLGTDNMAALVMAKEYYNCEIAGFSIPASEHSTITAWGKENENKAMENMLDKYPTGLVACVSDSYNIYNACNNIWGKELKEKIINRDGVLVIRPDSGHPPTMLLKVLEILENRFGVTKNEKGYKLLHPKIRIIQGDGCNFYMCKEILETLKKNNWSSDNIAFGMGGALLQNLNRDTQKFAFKCSAILKNNKWEDVFKEPIDDSYKKSKARRMKLVIENNTYKTTRLENEREDQLVRVFKNGIITKEYTFDECRRNK